MQKKRINQAGKNLVSAAMLLALGLVLPFLTGQIPQIGNMMLPMHLPVLLCGLICGWQYGAMVGFVLPLFRSALFYAPAPPMCYVMAFELAAYGAVVSFLYERSRWQCVVALYRCRPDGAAGRVQRTLYLGDFPVQRAAYRHPGNPSPAHRDSSGDGGVEPHGAGALPQGYETGFVLVTS